MPNPARYAQRLVQNISTVSPPTRGINTTGSIAEMPPTDAIEMDNMTSSELGVTVREGWFEYATHIGGAVGKPVRTVMAYIGAPANSTVSPLAQSTLFAATDQGIYDIEGGGDMTAEPKAITLSGASYAGRFHTLMYTSDSGGQYLIACSEIDGAFFYDGVVWKKMTSVGGPGPGIVTGVDPATFVQPCAWKKHLIFVQRGTSTVWVLPIGSIGGLAEEFDFGPLMLNGGSIVGLTNWTQDAGSGTDDYLVIIGSSGDLVVYEGSDPSNPDGFRCRGTWYIGQPPVGRRCFTTTGGNVYVLTQFGVVPVMSIVQGGLDNILTSDTDQLKQLRKIQDVLNQDFQTMLNIIGWELLAFPNKAMLYIARPSVASNEYIQYSFQQHNLAWSRFLDIPARTFGLRLSECYGGTDDGRVLRILAGNVDGVLLDGTGATDVRARLTPAFSYFGQPTVLKQALMIRLNFLSTKVPGYNVLMNTDFAISPIGGAPVGGNAVGSLWDASFWDQAYWSGSRVSYAEWRSIEALGYSITPSIFISSQQSTTLASIDYMIKSGGPL